MANSPLFIGIDLGTSAVRAVAIDETDAIRGQASVALPAASTDGPRVEQEAAVWWRAVDECLATLSAQIDSAKVAAIAVDGTSGSLLLTDEQLEPLGPALMYNDARATAQAKTIAHHAPQATAAQGPSCTLAKLLWLAEHRRTHKARHLAHQADWIAAKLGGRTVAVTDYNNALKLGYDAQQGQWPPWLLALLSEKNIAPQLLPQVVAPGTDLGQLSTDNARQFGLPASIRIVAGTTDSTASFIATGASQVGEAVTVLGSTLVVKVISNKPIFSARYGVYSHPLSIDGQQYWLVGGGSNSGGAVLRQYFTQQQLDAMTAKLKPEQPTGLDYYPLLGTGERFPVNDSAFSGKLDPRPADDVNFFQGMLEGIAGIEAQAYELLHTLGAPRPVSIRSTGGGAANQAWTTIRKRYLGENIKLLKARQTEAAFGSAMIARQSVTSLHNQ